MEFTDSALGEERQELPAPVPVLAPGLAGGGDVAGGDLQGGKQGEGPVPDVVLGSKF